MPAADRDGDLAAAYGRRLHHADPAVRAAAAQAWCDWEDTHASLAPDAEPRLSIADPAFQLAFARLVTHYWAHDCFLADRQLLGNADRLAGIPGVLVHGRLDVTGPWTPLGCCIGPGRAASWWSSATAVTAGQACPPRLSKPPTGSPPTDQTARSVPRHGAGRT